MRRTKIEKGKNMRYIGGGGNKGINKGDPIITLVITTIIIIEVLPQAAFNASSIYINII